MTDRNRLTVPSPEEVDRLSIEERAAMATAYLQGLEPAGKMHYELFVQLARLVVLSTVEIVPLRNNTNTDNLEVLLTQRPDTDRWWAGQWHVPGTVIFPIDEVSHDQAVDFGDSFNPIASYRSPVERIIKDELKDGIRVVDDPHLLGARFRQGIRGHESTVMLWARVETIDESGPPFGQFFEVEEIAEHPPEAGLIVGHADLIKRAAIAYDSYQT